jgi:acetyl esterase/lipase
MVEPGLRQVRLGGVLVRSLSILLVVCGVLLAACGADVEEGSASTTSTLPAATTVTEAPTTTTTTLSTTTTARTRGSGPYAVRSDVVTGPATVNVTVWAPEAAGSWPIVYAIPGSGGSAERDLATTATELASHGVVVFGTDFRPTPFLGQQDMECGYRFIRDIAADYNADMTQPVTILGYSAGATGAMVHGLSEESYGPDSNLDLGCPPGVPRPDIIVSINGCHASETNVEDQVRFWDNQDARIVLISGAEDEVCGTWQSEQAQTALRDAGYDVSLTEIPDANHWQVIFHDMSFGNYTTLESDEPAGQATVTAILEAIGADSD